MNLLDSLGNIGKKIKQIFGINLNFGGGGKKIDTDGISTIQTCTRILTENVSRLPLIVRGKDGHIIENHPVSKAFNRSFNGFLTADKGRKIIERDRVLNGNGFAIIKYNIKGELQSLTPVPYVAVQGIVLRNDTLYYAIDHSLNPFTDREDRETINGEEILHFTSSNIKEFVGISPVKSLIFEASIRQRASETLINFYKNNAMSPVVLSSSIGDMSQIKALKEFTKEFEIENTGSSNAGKVIKLPPGMKLDSLDYKFADAELINTLKFTNQEIISAFGIPSFLMSYETTQSIENQTLEFKTFTLNAIQAGYKSEIENKLLTTKEINEGVYIDFDYSVLLDADLKTKANAYKMLVSNGLCTHNEALIKLGFKPIDNENGDKHYMQAQYVKLEEYNQNNVENNDG
jgi:HK97 family phage portal protein